jgi:hypothetical protein
MTPTESATIDHAELERIAREICDSHNGAGHYDARGTKRAWWRAKAERMIRDADAMPVYKGLLRACGWPL